VIRHIIFSANTNDIKGIQGGIRRLKQVPYRFAHTHTHTNTHTQTERSRLLPDICQKRLNAAGIFDDECLQESNVGR
jgi:hypothetical protein